MFNQCLALPQKRKWRLGWARGRVEKPFVVETIVEWQLFSSRREILAVKSIGKAQYVPRAGTACLPPLHLTLHLTLHAMTHHTIRVGILMVIVIAGDLLDSLCTDALGS